jgi:hypothetical protein
MQKSCPQVSFGIFHFLRAIFQNLVVFFRCCGINVWFIIMPNFHPHREAPHRLFMPPIVITLTAVQTRNRRRIEALCRTDATVCCQCSPSRAPVQ